LPSALDEQICNQKRLLTIVSDSRRTKPVRVWVIVSCGSEVEGAIKEFSYLLTRVVLHGHAKRIAERETD